MITERRGKRSYIWNSKTSTFDEVFKESSIPYSDIVEAEAAHDVQKAEQEERDTHSGNYI